MDDTTVDVGPAKQHKTLADVIATGAALMKTRGYEGTSISDIAAALGIRKSTVYHHVESKQQLLYLIVQDYQSVSEALIDRTNAAGGAPLERLQTLITGMISSVSENSGLPMVFLAREIGLLEDKYKRDVLETRDRFEHYVEDLIREGQTSGDFRPTLEARLVALGILSLVTGTQSWYRASGPRTASEVASTYIELLFGGLAAKVPSISTTDRTAGSVPGGDQAKS